MAQGDTRTHTLHIDRKNVRERFDALADEYERERISGSIEIHFSEGVGSKIHAKKVL